MGRLVVVEGLDGAGKRTLTDALSAALGAAGARVTRFGFPRYEDDVHAELARDALHGRLGDLAGSVHGMAVLFALDRRAAVPQLRSALAGHDVVLVDRYVASNAAYGAARLHQDAAGEFVRWVCMLEIERFTLPVPDRQLLLDVPQAVAARRAAHRESTEPGRERDAFESDAGLQQRTGAVYAQLAAAVLALAVDGPRRGRRGRRRGARRCTDGRNGTRTRRAGPHSHLTSHWDSDAMKSRVLVVDDDPALAEMLTIVLRGEGFDTAVVGDGTRALPAVRELRPDVVLLDLMLPGMNGIDVCRAIRLESGVPIVMLTAKTDTVDVVLGLESGADDYVVKPFKPKELVARIRARVRRTEAEPAEQLAIGEVTIDVPAHQVTRAGEPIALTPLEFDLLVALARKPRQVFTREVLLEQVWGYRHAADTRLVNVHVQRLRSKVERDPEHPEVVLTVRGVGYKAGPP